MDTYFSDKVAVVTGAGGIICSQVSLDLAKQGMTVILIGRTLEKLEKTAASIREIGGKCECFTCDVTDEKAEWSIWACVRRTKSISSILNKNSS